MISIRYALARTISKEDAEVIAIEIMRKNHSMACPYQSPLEAEAKCYDKLGDKKKAQELRKLIPKGKMAKY